LLLLLGCMCMCRGRWHGTDVAVKIISCTPDELPKVLKEAEVMMQVRSGCWQD
jgi:hypothetical protein